jgi:hypothetical protein
VWTLQETALAKKCILIVGKHKIPMEIADWCHTFMVPVHDTLVAFQNGKKGFMAGYSGFTVCLLASNVEK